MTPNFHATRHYGIWTRERLVGQRACQRCAVICSLDALLLRVLLIIEAIPKMANNVLLGTGRDPSTYNIFNLLRLSLVN